MNGTKINLKYDNLNEFIKITTSFESNIDMIKDRYVIDAKSLLGVLSLDFTQLQVYNIIYNHQIERTN